MAAQMDYTPEILRNRGVPLPLAAVGDDGRLNPDDPVTLYLRMDMNSLAEVEERWGTLDGFQEALQTRPAMTIRAVLAMTLRMSETEVGSRMLIEFGMQEYAERVALSFMLANGVDPKEALRLLRQGRPGSLPQDPTVDVEGNGTPTPTPPAPALSTPSPASSPSPSGSAPGAPPIEASKSSGV